MFIKLTFFFSLMFLYNSYIYANCAKKVDQKKVVLFIDTNNSDMEIDVAMKAACTRGEALVVIPKDYKEYTNLDKKRNDLIKKNKSCESSTNKDSCSESVMSEIKKVDTEKKNLWMKNYNFSPLIEKELSLLKEQGATIKNVTISGHDGGGSFGGNKTNFSRQDLAKVLDKFPEVNEVQSLNLLGCYTGVKNEVINWMGLFPDLRLIGGYDGSAPSSEKPAGHQYLKDLLEKEKKLISQSDEKKIISNLKSNLSSLGNLYAGIYIKPACQNIQKDSYLYETIGGSKVTKIEINDECFLKGGDLKKLRIAVEAYSSGEKEPPANSSTGELRTLYNEMRKNEHCSNLGVSPKVVFGLLFNEGMKKSFGAYYKKELDEMNTFFENYSEKTAKEISDNQQKMIENQKLGIKEAEQQLELLNKNPELAKKEIEKFYDQLVTKYNQAFNNPEVKNFAEDNGFKPITNQSEIASFDFHLFHKLKDKNGPIADFLHINMGLLMQQPSLKAVKQNDLNQLKRISEANLKNLQMSLQYIENNTHPVVSVEEMKKVWIPTAEKLATKTRKEILLNSHALNGLLSSRTFPMEQAASLYHVIGIMERHLINYDNPFSWHEYTGGHVEAPSDVFGIGGGMGMTTMGMMGVL